MNVNIPFLFIVIAGLLAIVFLISWRFVSKVKGEIKLPNKKNKKVFLIFFIMGLILILVASFIMISGDILGDNTSGISTIIGIVGISLISSSNFALIGFGRKNNKDKE